MTEDISITTAEPGVQDAGEPPGPYAVGEYAAALRRQLRGFQHVRLIGEIVNLRVTRARAYFELRDADGAIPCAVWLREWEQIVRREGQLGDGRQVVVAGGCDYYPGSATSSPSFSFSATDLRIAGEGDLLARIERLRRRLHAEGLMEPQKRLPRPALPRTIAVLCSESGKARDDVIAALGRRGWAGRLVFAYAPVQDRRAAPAISRALAEIAACGQVDVAIVARGGGSLADLMCFCEESLCRTVAMLPVPVIASVGHHTDRTLLDEVAAVSCSTPTHAAEAAVAIDCAQARRTLAQAASHLRRHSRRAPLERARTLAVLCRAPAAQLARQRALLHQRLREARAGAARRLEGERALTLRRLDGLAAKRDGALHACRHARRSELTSQAIALQAHDPERTLRRGYALVCDGDGEPVSDVPSALRALEVTLRFADGAVCAEVRGER